MVRRCRQNKFSNIHCVQPNLTQFLGNGQALDIKNEKPNFIFVDAIHGSWFQQISVYSSPSNRILYNDKSMEYSGENVVFQFTCF